MVSALTVSRAAATAAYEASRQPSNSVTALSREATVVVNTLCLSKHDTLKHLRAPPVLQLGGQEVQLVA